MLNILASFTAAFFVVLYGFQFGKSRSEQWFSTFFLSFIQDVFVAQPLKVLGLALFIALVIKKPSEDDDDDDIDICDKDKIHALDNVNANRNRFGAAGGMIDGSVEDERKTNLNGMRRSILSFSTKLKQQPLKPIG